MTHKMVPHARRLTLLAACAMLAACGGGSSNDGSVGKAQYISFLYPASFSPAANTLVNGPSTMSAKSSSGLPVTYESGTPATCTVVNGNQLQLNSSGECLVYASQAGGVDADGVQWARADTVSQLFNVLKHPQAVTFAPPEYVLSSQVSQVPLVATSQTGQVVQFSTSTPTVCAIEGATLKLLGKGSCAVTASEPLGNANYAPQSVSRFIAVDPLLVADGFTPAGASGAGTTDSAYKTKQGGAVSVKAFSNNVIGGGWEFCANTNVNWCYHGVSAAGDSLMSALHMPPNPTDFPGWDNPTNQIDVFAPGITGLNWGADTNGNLTVTSESVLSFTLGVNSQLIGKPVVVELVMGKNGGDDCNVTVSTVAYPNSVGQVSYGLPLANFVVTKKCHQADLTEAKLDDVRKLPNYNDAAGSSTNMNAFKAALDKFGAARTSGLVALKAYPIVKVRFRSLDVNTTQDVGGVRPTDLTISGAITVQ